MSNVVFLKIALAIASIIALAFIASRVDNIGAWPVYAALFLGIGTGMQWGLDE